MRWPARSRRHAPSVSCPRGQVGRGLVCALAITLATPASPARAHQSPPSSPPETPAPGGQEEAIRQFRAAKQLYGAGAFADAAAAFAASYAAAASPEAAYNAALAHDKVGDDIATMAWVRRYLAIARSDDPSYPQAQQRALELRARLGELRLQLDSTDEIREIHVNGEVVALTDFPRLVTPGRVQLQLVGTRPEEVADIPVEVAPGGTWTVQFTGFARPEPAPPPRPTPRVIRPEPTPVKAATRRGRPLPALFWTGTGLTTASAITMGVLGGLVLRERAAHEHCVEDGTCVATNRSFHRYRDATNVTISITAGLAVITLALGIAALRERRKSAREPASGRVRVTFTGLQLAF